MSHISEEVKNIIRDYADVLYQNGHIRFDKKKAKPCNHTVAEYMQIESISYKGRVFIVEIIWDIRDTNVPKKYGDVTMILDNSELTKYQRTRGKWEKFVDWYRKDTGVDLKTDGWYKMLEMELLDVKEEPQNHG